MANSQEDNTHTSDTQQMEKIRQLVLGEDGHLVKQTLKDNAREVVGEVFSEALHDRERQDGSVNKVLLPLVEKSVEKSVANHSEQFVGYLYPLVGSLVRKSVTAFITELLEKTNALIENSLTIKGLKWRFRAWQANVSFSQYVASQTFSFRVEQVFLIHRETGLLLNSVSLGLGAEADADADMVSSMLTAINDFVSDSFKPNADSTEQQLDIVRTDDFTLLIKQGPKALIVAAVTGNMPQNVANQLQVTLEEIHKLYDKELNSFKGDALVFENTQNQLRDCLISELKPEGTKKRPWMAWLVVILLFIGCGFLSVLRWQALNLQNQIQNINNEPGVLITELEVTGLQNIKLSVLRDPSAIAVKRWLTEHNLPLAQITHTERAYLSLDPPLIKSKVHKILQAYPSVDVEWSELTPNFRGNLTGLDKLLLQDKLSSLIGLNFIPTWLDNITVNIDNNKTADDPTIIRAILDLNIAKIDSMSVAFEKGESELSISAQEKLISIKDQFNNLIQVAERQNLSLGLIIMGATDSIGTPRFNQILSQKRADNVKLKLQELGINANRLNAIGLGVIDLKTTNQGARKVLFNVVYFDASQ